MKAFLLRWLYWLAWVCALPLMAVGLLVHLLGGAVPFNIDFQGVVHWRPIEGWIHARIFAARLASAYTMGASIVWPSIIHSFQVEAMEHEKHHVLQGLVWMACAFALWLAVQWNYPVRLWVWECWAVGTYFAGYGLQAGWSLIRTGNIWGASPAEIDATWEEKH